CCTRKLLLHTELLTIPARRNSCMPLKERTEEGDIPIAHRVTDLLNRAMIAFQQPLGGGYTQLLEIDQGTVSGGVLETADKVSQAHAHTAGGSVQRKRPMKILMEPILGGGNGIVAVLGFQRDDGEAGLPRARRIDEQRLGALHGDL